MADECETKFSAQTAELNTVQRLERIEKLIDNIIVAAHSHPMGCILLKMLGL